jgi:hypothetical protein
MSDAGEALVDADARIQERMEDLARERATSRSRGQIDRALAHEMESLKLARTALERQLAAAVHGTHRAQLTQAIEEVARRLAGASADRAR